MSLVFPETQRDVTADGPPFRIERHGDWYHGDGKIERAELVALFASILRRTESGEYWLWHTGERCRVTVEDTPFIIDDVQQEGNKIICQPRHRAAVTLGAAHPLIMINGVPCIDVEAGLLARCPTRVYYQLVDVAREENGTFVLASDGAVFELGAIDAAA